MSRQRVEVRGDVGPEQCGGRRGEPVGLEPVTTLLQNLPSGDRRTLIELLWQMRE
jgi:hypothetical protein